MIDRFGDNIAYPVVTMLVVILVALLGVWSYASGLDKQSALASRLPGDSADEEARRPINRFNAIILRTGVGRYLQRRLLAAGLQTRVGPFALLILVACALGIIITWNALAPAFAILAVVIVAWAFMQFLRQSEERRREEFVGQLPELARVLSNAFSAGLALRTAVEIAADELAEPAQSELRITADSLALGQPTDQALTELGERLPSRELSVLVSTLVISSRAGGSMVTALRNIAQTLETRKEVRREIKTVLAQAVYTGYLIAVLGIGELFLFNAILPGSINRLTHNPIGIVVLIVSCALFAVGVVSVLRMSRVDI